jgi:NitT/TauT family transport system permease protein
VNAQKVLLPAMVAIALIGLWHGLVKAFDIPEFLVPSPGRVAETMVKDWGLLGGSLFNTLKITFLAFFCAVVLGVAVAFLFVQSKFIEAAFFPYAVLLQVTPIVAIAPLIIIWVKEPTTSLVICATLVALFPIISNTTQSVASMTCSLASGDSLPMAVILPSWMRMSPPNLVS